MTAFSGRVFPVREQDDCHQPCLEKQKLHSPLLGGEKRHQAIKGLLILMKSRRSPLFDQTCPPLSLQSAFAAGFG